MAKTIKNYYYDFEFKNRRRDEDEEPNHGEVVYNMKEVHKLSKLSSIPMTTSAWSGYFSKYGSRHTGWEDSDFPLPKKKYHFMIDYPLDREAHFEVECKSRNEMVETILRAYHQIYSILEMYPDVVSQWGHAITDLVIENVRIYEDDYVQVSVGS